MKNLVTTLLASGAVAALVSAVPAHAEGFQGGRIEVRAGWDSVKLDGELSTLNPTLTAHEQSSESGLGLGIEAGYDFMVASSVLLGAYVGVDFGTADFCRTVFVDGSACLEAGRDWSVGVRAGVPVSDDILIYMKGGYSNGKLKADFDDLDGFVTVNPPLVPPVAIGDLDGSKTAGGIHFGIGGEMNFGSNFYGKLEYVHINYSNGNFDGPNVHLGLDAKRNRLMLGAGLRF